MDKEKVLMVAKIIAKLILSAACILISYYAGFLLILLFMIQGTGYFPVFVGIGIFVLTLLFLVLIWSKKPFKVFVIWLVLAGIFAVTLIVNYAINEYDKRITIDVTPNINIEEYLPFDEDSMIVKVDDASLKLYDNLPVVDGAAAVFPVYSAFVNAVYPETTQINDGIFQYNNTSIGYRFLAEKKTDIFFGAYPSVLQIADALGRGTTFEYTPIGKEAFVFFVHKNNPVDSLTADQIRGIYAGEITNWKEVGGLNEEIVAFQ